MNTEFIFCDVAGSHGQESYRPATRFQAVCRMAATRSTRYPGLWFALALMASGIVFSSAANAEDDARQDPPRRQPRSAARSYPDDELPSREVAVNDDTQAVPIPTPPGTVDSPSNKPAEKKKAVAADDAVPDDQPRPTRPAHAAPRRAATVEQGNVAEQGDLFENPDEGSDEGDFAYRGPNLRGILANRLWFRGDALLWWLKGGGTPPLLTTSPGSTAQAQAGVLGQPNTTVLFGDQELNTGLHAGSRLNFGLWLDNCEQSGIEFSYLIMGENDQTYSNASTGIPILARPFFNVATGAQDSNLIAYPNTYGGTFNASSTENFQGAEALFRHALVNGCDGRMDVLVGYRFQRLTDGLQLADSVTTSGSASVAPAGTTINVSDTFHTRNDFNGGELGFATQWRRNRWSLDSVLKLGIGQTNTKVLIDGWTTVVANGTTVGYSGGQLALPSNMGIHSSQQFSMMPEIGFTLGYDLTPRLKATAGYTLLYWSNVARPGDQIDLNLDPAQFPPPTTTTGTKPEFALHTSDFWAQGLNLGLDYHF